MNLDKLIKSDLNLLVTFQILMEERSVSKAAERLHLSQPAVSKTLNRLREQFDDPLFVRKSQGLTPSVKALALYENLPDLLIEVDRFLNAESFNIRDYNGVMRIASCELFIHFLYPLIETCQQEAPSLRLEVVTIGGEFFSNLHDATLDFALHPSVPTIKEEVISAPIQKGKFVCYVNKSHPLAKKEQLTFDEYLEYEHVRAIIPNYRRFGYGIVENTLAAIGDKRRIKFETNFLSLALEMTAKTNCILTLGNKLDSSFGLSDQLVQVRGPEELESVPLVLDLYYDRRIEKSTAHLWMREKIISAVQEVDS